MFLPLQNDPLKAKFFGPYKVLQKLNPVNYLIATPDRRKKTRLCHINTLKAYFNREEEEETSTPIPILSVSPTCEEAQAGYTEVTEPKFKNSEVLQNLDQYLSHLDEEQKLTLNKS